MLRNPQPYNDYYMKTTFDGWCSFLFASSLAKPSFSWES